MKNKRGDIAVTLLVFMALLVAGAAIFSFITNSGKIGTEILDARAVGIVYLEQNHVEFTLEQIAKDSFAKTYKEMAVNYAFIGQPIEMNPQEEAYFKNINENIDNWLKERFIENFKAEFTKYNFEENYLKNIKDIIGQGNFDASINKEILLVQINKIEFSESFFKKDKEKIRINYMPKIFAEISMKKIGLHSFQEIYDAKESCKGGEKTEEMKNCFSEKLNNFNVKIEEKKKSEETGETYKLVILESKREFLIDSKFENIEFKFIPK